MNKKGFTFIEIIVVIALLGAIMLLVVPNITKNFKESKKKLFYDNVLGIYSSASRTYFSQDNASNKSFSNTGVKLDVDISDDITYRVKVDSYGAVLSIYVTDGTYTYKLDNANGISKKDIKLANVIEGVIEGKVDSYLTLYEQLLEDNPTIKTRTSFNTIFTETNTGTLYKATESIANSPAKDVYYFAGNAKNNWVKFGKYQSENVAYRGYYSATSNDFIEYLTMDECNNAASYNYNCAPYKYASAGDPIYWRIIRTNHDGSIRLLYAGTSPDTTEGYIGRSAFSSSYNDLMYLGYMYGTSGSQANNRTNTNNSTIKTYIDNWYSTYLSSYSKYISTEAVYCNDRKAPSYSASSNFFYYVSTRLNAGNPTYNCEDSSDAFSGSTTGGGNGKLTYPIGLMTADEITYAGGKFGGELTSPYAWYYLNSAGSSITGIRWWWLLSPGRLSYGTVESWFVRGSDYPGIMYDSGGVTDSRGVRPAISLKTCTKYSKGNGTASSPYEIQMDGGC